MEDSRDLERAIIATSFTADFISKIDGVLTIKKDDVIMINVPENFFDIDISEELKKMFKIMGFDNKVVVLQNHFKVSLLRKEVSEE